MINAVIVDDEAHCRKSLLKLLSSFPEIDILGESSNVELGKKLVKSLKPDLLFLDIEMPDGTGFDLLEQFTDRNFQVIFTTGHNNYAIMAFKHSAIDYLLKPVNKSDLKLAIEKVIRSQSNEHNNQKIELMLRSLENKEFSKIALPAMDSFELVNKKDVICCEADSNYSIVFLSDGRQLTTTNTLKRMDEILNERMFFRVHKSFIVNVNYVRKVLKSDGGSILMENDVVIPVARRRKEEFLNLLGL